MQREHLSIYLTHDDSARHRLRLIDVSHQEERLRAFFAIYKGMYGAWPVEELVFARLTSHGRTACLPPGRGLRVRPARQGRPAARLTGRKAEEDTMANRSSMRDSSSSRSSGSTASMRNSQRLPDGGHQERHPVSQGHLWGPDEPLARGCHRRLPEGAEESRQAPLFFHPRPHGPRDPEQLHQAQVQLPEELRPGRGSPSLLPRLERPAGQRQLQAHPPEEVLAETIRRSGRPPHHTPLRGPAHPVPHQAGPRGGGSEDDGRQAPQHRPDPGRRQRQPDARGDRLASERQGHARLPRCLRARQSDAADHHPPRQVRSRIRRRQSGVRRFRLLGHLEGQPAHQRLRREPAQARGHRHRPGTGRRLQGHRRPHGAERVPPVEGRGRPASARFRQ